MWWGSEGSVHGEDVVGEGKECDEEVKVDVVSELLGSEGRCGREMRVVWELRGDMGREGLLHIILRSICMHVHNTKLVT